MLTTPLFDAVQERIEYIHTYLEQYENHRAVHDIKGKKESTLLIISNKSTNIQITKMYVHQIFLHLRAIMNRDLLVQQYATMKNKVVERFKFHTLKQAPL